MSAINETTTGDAQLKSLQALNMQKIGVEVRLRADNQFGVFSTTKLPAGHVIHSVRPAILFRTPSRYTVQVSRITNILVKFIISKIFVALVAGWNIGAFRPPVSGLRAVPESQLRLESCGAHRGARRSGSARARHRALER